VNAAASGANFAPDRHFNVASADKRRAMAIDLDMLADRVLGSS